MPSVTVVPDADGTGYGFWTVHGGPSTRYGAINNGTSSPGPDDTDYIHSYISENWPAPNETTFFGFENMPADFLAATTITAKIRQKILVQAGNDGAKYQIVQSDGTTALSDEIVLDADGTDISSSYRTDTLSFTRTGATSQTVWNGVQIKVIHNGGGDGDDPQMWISEMQLEIGYTAAAAGGKLLPFIQAHQRIEDDATEF
jgi:hypothetical protein